MTEFTSTTSTLIANTFQSGNHVSVYNAGAGTLYILIHDVRETSATVVSGAGSVALLPGGLYETPPGVVGKLYAIFGSAGTAYVTESAQRS